MPRPLGRLSGMRFAVGVFDLTGQILANVSERPHWWKLAAWFGSQAVGAERALLPSLYWPSRLAGLHSPGLGREVVTSSGQVIGPVCVSVAWPVSVPVGEHRAAARRRRGSGGAGFGAGMAPHFIILTQSVDHLTYTFSEILATERSCARITYL